MSNSARSPFAFELSCLVERPRSWRKDVSRVRTRAKKLLENDAVNVAVISERFPKISATFVRNNVDARGCTRIAYPERRTAGGGVSE